MLPISLRPNGRRAVIVGGGTVAARKAQSILSAGFPLFVVAESVHDGLRDMIRDEKIHYAQRPYKSDDVEGAAFVVAATDDPQLNARIVEDSRNVRVLSCDASNPQRGDFTMPAAQRLGHLTISVDSGGEAPAFSRRLVGEIVQNLGAEYPAAVAALASMRRYVKTTTFSRREREQILRTLAQRPVAELAAMPITAVCATRRSELAMIQSRAIASRLAQRGIITTMLGVTTAGDRDRTTPVERFGETNVFVKELETALREKRADYAVHSCKDLPASLDRDMRIAAISRREDARDAFCSERYVDFRSLPAGAVVGTSSVRRRTQLAAIRTDLRYESLRGNVDTRLRKLREGEYDAIVIAMAGLNRLRARAAYVVPFALEEIVPAVGQGALAVETRADDDRLIRTIQDTVNDPSSELCVVCERAALRAMRGGCSAPLGIHAHFEDNNMIVVGVYLAHGAPIARTHIEHTVSTLGDAERLGSEVAAQLNSGIASARGAAI